MNEVFKPYLPKFVLFCFDDILVYSRTLEDHSKHLGMVLQPLHKHSLFVNHKKCSFGCSSVEYLGHVVSKEVVSADPTNTAAMLSWPVPQNLRELRGFIGLIGYYGKFVAGYGMIARPLTDQLK